MWVLNRLLICAALMELALAYAIIVLLWWPWPLLLLLILVGRACQRRKYLWTHGTARWATHNDLLDAQMMGVEKGLSIGRLMDTEPLAGLPGWHTVFDGRLSHRDACIRAMTRIRRSKKTSLGDEVRLTKTPHTMIVSPTGLGKTTSLIIDQLREAEESIVILDYKAEIANLTAVYRQKKLGHTISLLDPYECFTKTPDSFNPLDFIHRDSPHAVDQCRYLADTLVVREPGERDKHFSDAAEMWITAAILGTVLFAPSHRRSLQHVRELLSDPKRLIELVESLEAYGEIPARVGRQLRHFQDRELASTLTTANRHLRWLDSPAIVASTSHSTFDPRNLRRSKATVYCIIPPKFVHTAAPLLRLWIGSFMMAIMDEGLRQGVVRFVLDEAATLGEMRCITEAIQKGRGYGINLQLYYQSTAQLKLCFPFGQDENVLANVSQVYFGVNNSLADQLSARIGEQTIVVNSGGHSSGSSRSRSMGGMQDSVSYSETTSRNWSFLGRRLLKPEEILTMSERIALTFVPGIRPIRTVLERYYEKDPRKKKRPLKKQIFGEALCLFIVASFSLFFVYELEESIKHVRIHQPTNRTVFPRNYGGRKATSGPWSFRNSSGDLQRQRARDVRSGPAYERG